MTPKRILAAMMSCLALTACAGSTDFAAADRVVAGVTIDDPPPELTADCNTPRPITTGRRLEVERVLNEDAADLIWCRNTKAALVAFIRDRDARLRGRVVAGPPSNGGGAPQAGVR